MRDLRFASLERSAGANVSFFVRLFTLTAVPTTGFE